MFVTMIENSTFNASFFLQLLSESFSDFNFGNAPFRIFVYFTFEL